jgi:hypothetical protein
MEAPDGRVRPPSGAAQRPQRRLHRRFPGRRTPGTTTYEARRGRRAERSGGRRGDGERGLINILGETDGRTAAEVVDCSQENFEKETSSTSTETALARVGVGVGGKAG